MRKRREGAKNDDFLLRIK